MSIHKPTTSSRCKLCLDQYSKLNVRNPGNVITVGIGGCSVAKASNILRTTLGSCVGVTLYDKSKQLGGLIHIMLPDSSRSNGRLTKFADTGIPNMIYCMISEYGSSRSMLVAKMFGGAKMFNVLSKALDVGYNNAIACRNVLKQQNIRIVSEKTGGTKGTQISFDTSNGQVKFKTIGGREEVF